jgi:hypothetical protein
MALKTGEPHRIARALAIEVGYRFFAGSKGQKSTRAALAVAEALAERLGNPPNLQGQGALMTGIGGILEGRWNDARNLLSKAETILTERCSGVGWEISSARIMHLWSLWYLGEMKAIAARLPNILREAEERGDLYAATSYRTFFVPMAQLAADDVVGATEGVSHVLDRWSQQGFHFQHYCRFFAGVQLKLYRGDYERALELCEQQWASLKASFILSAQQNKVEALHFLGRAELARGRQLKDDRLVKRALKRARSIRREKSGWGDGLAALLEAGAAWARGQAAVADRLLEEGIRQLERREMALFVAASRRALGEVRGGERGAALIADADEAFAALGIVNPARMAAMLAPGFDRVVPALVGTTSDEARPRTATAPIGDGLEAIAGPAAPRPKTGADGASAGAILAVAVTPQGD